MPARKFGSQIDLQKIPVLGIVPESSATAPTSPVSGQQWVDTSVTPNRLKVYENGAWTLASQNGVELLANKGVANGYAALDGTVKVPIAQIPTGTTASTVALGNDARLSDNRTPIDNTVSTIKIVDLAVTDAKVAAANKDGAVGTFSMRTLGYSGLAAMPGIARLDQIAAPTAPVSLNSQRISNLADPSAAQDAATKSYVDANATGLDVKASVRVASTANVAVTYNATGGTSARGQITAAPNTIDGVTLAVGNRVLLKDQTAGAQNGIWTVTTVGTGANGVWDRATDFDQDAEVTAGAFTFVEEGTVNDNIGYTLTTNNPIVIGGAGGTALAWAQFSSPGTILAGNGLTKNANTLSAVGTAGRIAVGTGIDIDAGYVGQASITTLGTISTGVWAGTAIAVANGGTGATTAVAARANLGAIAKESYTLAAMTAGVELVVNHTLNTTDVQATFRTTADGMDVGFSWRVISTTQIGVTADVAYGASTVRVVIVG